MQNNANRIVTSLNLLRRIPDVTTLPYYIITACSSKVVEMVHGRHVVLLSWHNKSVCWVIDGKHENLFDKKSGLLIKDLSFYQRGENNPFRDEMRKDYDYLSNSYKSKTEHVLDTVYRVKLFSKDRFLPFLLVPFDGTNEIMQGMMQVIDKFFPEQIMEEKNEIIAEAIALGLSLDAILMQAWSDSMTTGKAVKIESSASQLVWICCQAKSVERAVEKLPNALSVETLEYATDGLRETLQQAFMLAQQSEALVMLKNPEKPNRFIAVSRALDFC